MSDAGPAGADFVELLYAGAPAEDFDAAVESAAGAGLSAPVLARLRERRDQALLLRERMQRHQQREAELSALYETANDLIAIRETDAILAAIVRRARTLLGADMAYLSLNDEAEGASYMKVTDGSVSAEFRNLRLPLGTGLLGLVAQRGAPYYTDDYQADARFVHRDYIDHAVADERIRAILGVPLIVEGRVIGALLAGHRSVRVFPAGEVSLLTSFAAHAAVALENARLFEEATSALAQVEEANRRVGEQADTLRRAADAHDRLTGVLLRGGGAREVAAQLAEVLGCSLTAYDGEGRVVAEVGVGAPDPDDEVVAAAVARRDGRCVVIERDGAPVCVATAVAGAERMATLVLHGRTSAYGEAERRTVERAAVVMALVLLFARTVADAEERVRGELLADLLDASAGSDVAALRQRARRQGTDLDALGAVAVAPLPDDRATALRVAARLGRDVGGLGGECEGLLVVLAPGGAEDALAVGAQLARRLADLAGSDARGSEPPVGVAADGTGPAAVGAAWRDARGCLRALQALGRAGVSDATGLGVARLLLGATTAGRADLDDFVERQLGAVLDHDRRRGADLAGTLDAWFAAGGRSAETARVLHLHPNTVAQRLDRLAALLGPDWRSPDRALDLQLALRIRRLAGPSRPAGAEM